MEQGNLYEVINPRSNAIQDHRDAGLLSAYLCPSNILKDSDGTDPDQEHYVTYAGSQGTIGTGTCGLGGNSGGVFGHHNLDHANFEERGIQFRDVTDGTSSTIMIGEVRDPWFGWGTLTGGGIGDGGVQDPMIGVRSSADWRINVNDHHFSSYHTGGAQSTSSVRTSTAAFGSRCRHGRTASRTRPSISEFPLLRSPRRRSVARART